MKKRLILALLLTAALLTLCACSGNSGSNAAAPEAETDAVPETADSAPVLTMRDVLDANSGETLFPTYGGILKTYRYPDDADRYRVEYMDAEVLLFDYGYEQDLLFYDASPGYLHDDEGYAAILDFNFDPSYYAYPALDEALTEQEEVVSVTTDGDTLSLTSTLSVDAYRPYFGDDDFPYAEGDYFEEHYLLDASDYHLLEASTTLVHADGSREEQDTVTLEYGAARPEVIAELLARKNAEDPRTGTITLDPNTPEERSMSATAQKGDVIIFVPPEGYETFYTDPECTVERTADDTADLNADFTLYSKRADE